MNLSSELLVKLQSFLIIIYARLRTGGIKVMTHLCTLTTWDVGITSLRYVYEHVHCVI